MVLVLADGKKNPLLDISLPKLTGNSKHRSKFMLIKQNVGNISHGILGYQQITLLYSALVSFKYNIAYPYTHHVDMSILYKRRTP